jgi:hypothetical protein
MLEEDELREFVKLWEQEFNETLSLDEARTEASLLLELVALLSKPLPQKKSSASDLIIH